MTLEGSLKICNLHPCLPVESLDDVRTDTSTECVFVGLGDTVEHSWFCVFFFLVIKFLNQLTGGKELPTGAGSNRWRGSPVPVLVGGVAHRYGDHDQ